MLRVSWLLGNVQFQSSHPLNASLRLLVLFLQSFTLAAMSAVSGNNPNKVDVSDLEKGVDGRSRTSIESSPLGTSEEITIDVLGCEETNAVTRNKIHLVNDVSRETESRHLVPVS